MLGTRVLAMVLAGGAGERLRPLTFMRSKPAVPFGANLRVIDFTLLNCVASRLQVVYVLTQCESWTLERHCRDRWGTLRDAFGERIRTLPPRSSAPEGRYRGTADAVFQNLDVVRSHHPSAVLILSGDHVYHADYGALLRTHQERAADVTILMDEVGAGAASSFGVLETTPDSRVTRFVEKPPDPTPYSRDGKCAINLGVYCFRTEFLERELLRDATRPCSSHDFGKDILPTALRRGIVIACPLRIVCPDPQPYWRDVGTLDSFFESHMDLLGSPPRFRLTDCRWPAASPFHAWIPARIAATASIDGRVVRGWNMVAQRVSIEHASVVSSFLSPGVRVHEGATVEQCILLPGASVGAGARLRRVIVEEGAVVPPGASLEPVGSGARDAARGRGVVVFCPALASQLSAPTERRWGKRRRARTASETQSVRAHQRVSGESK